MTFSSTILQDEHCAQKPSDAAGAISRVSAFLDRFSKMGGQHPEDIYALDAMQHVLTVSDLRMLLAAASKNVSIPADFFSEDNPDGWQAAYSAFAGAFDTPVARRKVADEYSQDARIRLRNVNEVFSLAVGKASA